MVHSQNSSIKNSITNELTTGKRQNLPNIQKYKFYHSNYAYRKMTPVINFKKIQKRGKPELQKRKSYLFNEKLEVNKN